MSGKLRVAICLFRNDLRYRDNEALLWAHRNASHVLPLYCFDPRHYALTYHFGLQKTGPHRIKFLLESIQDLRSTLQKHGSNLIVRMGRPEQVVTDLITQLGKENVCGLSFHEECTKEELDIEEALKKCQVPVHSFWGSTLVHKEDVPFSIKQVPNVFTEFRKQVENRSDIRSLIHMPEKLRPLPNDVDAGDIPSYESLNSHVPEQDARTAFPFAGGETSGQKRLHNYLWETNAVATYKETRNGMIGTDYSTKFAAWLAHGCLSPRDIYWEIKSYEQDRTANKSTYWVIFELLWRDYFKFVAMKFGNKLFYQDGLLGKKIPWKQDMAQFKAWKEGRTGVPYIDANMRELAHTGFMSNRGRQNIASYLTKDLKLDWRLGAEWFESMLVDHDVCSNYGNWQYSAGIGNDPRQDRKFNIVKQGLDYDPNGEYIRMWVPELKNIGGGDAHTPWNMNEGKLAQAGVSLGENYPKPQVIAPEWGRHYGRQRSHQRSAEGGSRGQQRGVDFYFKGNSSRR